MSRLYAWLISDKAKYGKTLSGHEEIALRVNYGSKVNSNLAVRVRIAWLTSEEKPKVYVYPMEDISVKVCDVY